MIAKEIRGFTLIEVMIVVAIVAILASIAVPSYQEHIRKSRRAECTGVMLSLAAALERRYTTTYTYAGGVPAGFNAFCPQEGNVGGANSTYNLAIDIPVPPATFTITATPVGAQAPDRCGTLSYTHAGVKDQTGADVEVRDCW